MTFETPLPETRNLKLEAGNPKKARRLLLYHDSMAQRYRFALAILLTPALFALGGCKYFKAKPQPITVNVLCNLKSPYGNELDHRILDFQTSNPRTSSGRPIVIRPVEIGDYKDMLEKHIGRDINVQMVILDAPEDAALNPGIQADMAHAVNICAALKACPAVVPVVIPSGVEGDELEAAQKFQQALQNAGASS